MFSDSISIISYLTCVFSDKRQEHNRPFVCKISNWNKSCDNTDHSTHQVIKNTAVSSTEPINQFNDANPFSHIKTFSLIESYKIFNGISHIFIPI